MTFSLRYATLYIDVSYISFGKRDFKSEYRRREETRNHVVQVVLLEQLKAFVREFILRDGLGVTQKTINFSGISGVYFRFQITLWVAAFQLL